MYQTGHKEVPSKKSDLSFSDTNWGTQTLFYTASVRKVGEKKYLQIINEARKYCTAHRRCATAQAVSVEVTAQQDECMQIMVSSDIDYEVRLAVPMRW